MSKTSTASKRKYNEKAYDRTTLNLKKGQLELLKQVAREHGCSMNSLITCALEEYLWEEFAVDFNKYPKPLDENGGE
ncbi:MAG: Arc family DNA-binding protein [Ruminococcus sp.]|nr:Arc family DNA-binding protein [Ruminococcus sp.]